MIRSFVQPWAAASCITADHWDVAKGQSEPSVCIATRGTGQVACSA